jgi:hypothetical protein
MPAAAILLANLMFVIGARRAESGEEIEALVIAHLVFCVYLVADMIALSWVGMWLGLIHRKPNRAALLALARIVVLPDVVFIAAMCLSHPQNEDPAKAFIALCIVLGLVPNLWFGLAAHAKLHTQFRTIASEGVARKGPLKERP